MNIIEPLQARRARRALLSSPIAPEIRDRILTAATLAPSCMNKQPWRFIAVEGEAALTSIKTSLEPGNYWAQPAPLIVAVCTSLDFDARLDHGRDYAPFDTGMATMALMAQAQAEGLIAHPMAGFKPALAKEALAIPESVTLYVLIALAWPNPDHTLLNEKHAASEISERIRKPLDAAIATDTWPSAWTPQL